MAKLWCFNDAHNWGHSLTVEATKRGHDVRLFDNPREPDAGIVFFHMHHHPQVRLLHKRMLAIMATNPALTLIPSYRMSQLFDDKLEQARQLAKWMPRTHVFYTPGSAKRYLTAHATFPIVSKSSEGASRDNTRLLKSQDEALFEIRQAFSDIGVKCKYGQAQRGYLLWQEFVAPQMDVRVIAVGAQRLIMRRDTTPDAKGALRLKPVNEIDVDAADALVFVDWFLTQEDLRWCAVDIAKDRTTNEYRILEITASWTMHNYYDCTFVGMDRKGDDVWAVLMDQIEAEAFK